MKTYGVDYLQYEDVIKIIGAPEKAEMSAKAMLQVKKSQDNVKKIIADGKTVYGINTGFGPLCDTKISDDEISQLQHNLIISHSVGVGKPIDKKLSKIMMVAKIHALSKGFSGISPQVVERLQIMVEKDIIPVIPEQGSVGASGDLAPLSHMVLPLLGLGKVWNGDEIEETQTVLDQHNLEPLKLGPKEGLALINGTQFMVAHGVAGLDKMKYLLDLADLAAAMSLEAYQGSASPFKKELHEIRPFEGSQKVAERMTKLLKGSKNLKNHENCDRVQDPYSFRCVPQVHGASRNAWLHLKSAIETELNSVTDNPIVVSDEEAISGGNFHGQLIALPLDYATLAAAELGNISDRRSYLLLEGKYGLPKLLVESSGLNSGFMIPQYTSAALVTENKTLCFPASADSVPTSLGQEDHVSMGSISGRKFNQVLGNLENILAIELMFAAQGLEFRRPLKSSAIIEEAYDLIRTKVAKLENDREIGKDILAIADLIRERKFNVNI
ncbi:histidine ammonia-lyase [Elizabethkingia anophelis]|uniref:histidine ammonia-lyase n=1 Tax=Elizabethkingia anophelis TaxID=1117645 RepID=UPI0021A341EF|nr:histidine ammonia-lyase [Elizabethkingia anophelis]MCT3663899.1 histidine ammonia-lyase [Elizabethkingia anophelis]MCT3800420.1 histidine ammonia-lyase [Elizabethkingia anophelis]MCT3904504.1 histidine ammonia-lyase [Elizabethkingia anophelis]MCT4057141.1 histidine ammonia-lyase [Elizabethkingia anophelis]MCT4067972.1 histidine ammonia-lyase [Elizabethkingia anophelis]